MRDVITGFKKVSKSVILRFFHFKIIYKKYKLTENITKNICYRSDANKCKLFGKCKLTLKKCHKYPFHNIKTINICNSLKSTKSFIDVPLLPLATAATD